MFDHDNNLRTCTYILKRGLLEKRESLIQKLQNYFKIYIPNYEKGICPFEILEEKRQLFLQSKIFKIKMISFQNKIKLYYKSIFFYKKIFRNV